MVLSAFRNIQSRTWAGLSIPGSKRNINTVQCIVGLASPEKHLSLVQGPQETWMAAPEAQLGQGSEGPMFAEATSGIRLRRAHHSCR